MIRLLRHWHSYSSYHGRMLNGDLLSLYDTWDIEVMGYNTMDASLAITHLNNRTI